ncbi:hypothetical protein GCM10028798_10980 [Humibacter antri]
MRREALRTATGGGRSWTAAWRSIVESRTHRAVHDLHLAAERGDSARVASLLAPNVAVVVDAGDDEHPHAQIVRGTDDAVMVLLHGLAHQPGVIVLERPVNDQPGLVLQRDGEPIAVMTIDFMARLAVVLWIRLRPAKLRHWMHV